MRFHLGAIPDSPDFLPDSSWILLRQASTPWKENLLSLPIGVVAATALGVLWNFLTPLREIISGMSLPAFLLLFAGLVIIHELTHALVHPMMGLSRNSTLGYWPSLGFYAHYDGEMSRNRLIVCLLMPLIILSVIPLVLSSIARDPDGWVAFFSILNAFCASVDLLLAGLLLGQVPPAATVRFKTWRILWKRSETLAA